MSEILELINTYSTSKQSLNKEFSIELYNLLRFIYRTEDYVKSMELRDTFRSPYFAYYIPELKKMYVHFDKIMNDINKFIEGLHLQEQDKLFATYLCFFHMINHEFKHVCQEKEKDTNPDSVESRLLKMSDIAEKYYTKDGILFYKYGIDPIERQAEISSLRELINMAKTRKVTPLVTEMTKRYQENVINGYHGYLDDHPAKTFIEYSGILDFEYKPLFEELDNFPITPDNFDYRIQLGLRIDNEEYKKLVKQKM